MKPAHAITDRAKRYRAHTNPPPGPRRCNVCSSKTAVDIDHISGDESDGDQENLWYLCRSCNTRKGLAQKQNRIGIRTRQYNGRPRRPPAFNTYRNAALVLIGIEAGDVPEATEIVRATPPDQRALYGDLINPFKSAAQRRKFYAMAERGEIPWATVERWERETRTNPLPLFVQYAAQQQFQKYLDKAGKNPVPTFAQYAHGVSVHKRGKKDEGGLIIHATPPAVRSQYARRIAQLKKQRGSEVPF